MKNGTQNGESLKQPALKYIDNIFANLAITVIFVSLGASCAYVDTQREKARVEIEKIRADKDKNNK